MAETIEKANVQALQGLPSFMTTFWNSPEQLALALRWLTIVGILFTAAFGAAVYFVNDRIGALQAALIINQGQEIRDQKNIVESQSKTVSQQSGKITNLSDDLQSVRSQAAELAIRAQNAERGISDTYDFNGGHRQNMGGGRVVLAVGPEAGVFQKIFRLQSDKDWNELKEVCDDQIKATPTWLTPYLFSGIANANLGNLAVAKERLQFVVAKAGSDPNYSDAARILAQIETATR